MDIDNFLLFVNKYDIYLDKILGHQEIHTKLSRIQLNNALNKNKELLNKFYKN